MSQTEQFTSIRVVSLKQRLQQALFKTKLRSEERGLARRAINATTTGSRSMPQPRLAFTTGEIRERVQRFSEVCLFETSEMNFFTETVNSSL